MKELVQIPILQIFLVSLFTLLLHIPQSNVNSVKSMLNARVSARGLLSGNSSRLRRCHVFGFHQVVTEFSGVDGNRRILLY